MKRLLPVLAVLMILVTVVVVLWPKNDDVIVLCGGSMRDLLSDIIKRYEKVSDDTIEASYGGSGELCAQIQKAGRGDIYICHDPFMPWAAEQGLIKEWKTLGYLDVFIVLPKGNPKQIKNVKDLGQPGLRLGVGDQFYSTSGVAFKQVLTNLENADAVRKNIIAESKGQHQRCTDVLMGTLDAGVVWSSVANLFKDRLDVVPIPRSSIDSITSATYGKSDLKNVKLAIGLISHSADKKSAQDFYRFASEKCSDLCEKHGFRLIKE